MVLLLLLLLLDYCYYCYYCFLSKISQRNIAIVMMQRYQADTKDAYDQASPWLIGRRLKLHGASHP